jgi:hypothetical protein
MKTKLFCLAASLGFSLLASTANVWAATLSINAFKDSSVDSARPDVNFNNPSYIFTGDPGSSFNLTGLFGFDMSSLTSLVGPGETLNINSMTFSAYNVYNVQTGPLHIAVGGNDNWSESTVTFNSLGGVTNGPVLDTKNVGDANLSQFVSWNVSAVSTSEFLVDNLLTLDLFIDPQLSGNFHDFSPHDSLNGPSLFIDYTLTATPLPAALPLFATGLGALGLLGWRRKRKAQAVA